MPLNELELFLQYVRVDTRSRQALPGEEKTHPSTPGQTDLANMVVGQLLEIGVLEEQVVKLGDGSFIVTLPATPGLEDHVSAAFAAHLDTYYGCPGNATPIIHEYSEGDIVLPNEGVVIPAEDLAGLEGKRIVTADGTSLLGADDKAGVAAMVAVISRLVTENIPHGPLYFWFCVDEEIGEVGVKFLPEGMAKKWSIFWTVDGTEAGTIDTGCFNGAEMVVTFKGNDAHPGVAGDKLKPAHYAAARFICKLRNMPCPWDTSGEESFFYAFADGVWTPSSATVRCLPRTFDLEELKEMAGDIDIFAQEAAEEFGVIVEIGDLKVLYVSTEEAISANPHLLTPALEALKQQGFTPVQERVRAGTDGAMLNKDYPGIPAPNLGTGARNLHGFQEHLVVDEFVTLVPTILDIIGAYAAMA